MTLPDILDPARASDFSPILAAARAGDPDAFTRITEPYRAELRVHCYRLTGSLEDAEDLVQETFLRAWRRLETYEGRASFRAWLYKIATNAGLDALDHQPHRVLSLDSADSGPAREEGAASEPAWLEPFPDAWYAPASAAPEAHYDAYESISLAFLVALQVLPPRQRTALIFADVLDWPVADIADVLNVSVAAATSLLRRARVTMKERNQSGRLDPGRLAFPDRRIRSLLDRYARAWEAADVEGILALLADDANFPMPPTPISIHGKQVMAAFYAEFLFAGDARGRWKLLPIQANARPGFAFYRLDEATGAYRAFVLQVLEIEKDQVIEAATFAFPALFKYFNLPEVLG